MLKIVAPLVGAWIEMVDIPDGIPLVGVAPLVGAWIEILSSIDLSITFSSLPLWERGLKSG